MRMIVSLFAVVISLFPPALRAFTYSTASPVSSPSIVPVRRHIDELACHDITFCGKVDLSVDIHGLGVAAADIGLRFLAPALAQHFAHIAEDGFIVFVDDIALHVD